MSAGGSSSAPCSCTPEASFAGGDDLVSVVIPAYDAATTIDETLCSVRAQTHTALEILVVDDGSRDQTPDIAARHAAADPRVRIIRQENKGVAAARNAGIAAASGAFVAPIDADDLWRPDKIGMQVAAMRRHGPRAGLCCTGVHAIDRHGLRVAQHVPDPANDAFRAMCRVNLAGNGSSALMPLDLVRSYGGYDAGLRDSLAQGCEDWQLYLQIVEHHDFILVPQCLTGYRQHPSQMSGKAAEMVRSAEIVLGRVRARRPDCAFDLDAGLRGMCERMAVAALSAGDYATAIHLGRGIGPSAAARMAKLSLRNVLGRFRRRWGALPSDPPTGKPFLDGS
ncbi:MAG: glycosyltransferase family 2 protein [Burkholderiales bacterium]|nr:glycosyltransferase family 2 protein [Burkholderiales bacterium]